QVEQEVAARGERTVLDRGAIVQVTRAERHLQARQDVGGEAAVHEQRRRQRNRVALREAWVGVREVGVGDEPTEDLVARLEVDAPALRRAGGDEVAPRARLLVAAVAGEDELAVEVEEPDRAGEIELAAELLRARAELVAERLHERRQVGAAAEE